MSDPCHMFAATQTVEAEVAAALQSAGGAKALMHDPQALDALVARLRPSDQIVTGMVGNRRCTCNVPEMHIC
jgi:hypothetical protein